MIKVVLKFPLHNAITKSTWYSPIYTQAVVKIANKLFNLHNPPCMM